MADERLRKLKRQAVDGGADDWLRLVHERARNGDAYALATESALELKGFLYLRHETYACRGQSHEIALFEHTRTRLTFSLIPGGTFLMGSPQDEDGNSTSERPQHQVTIAPFLLSQTPCTVAAWQRVWKKHTPGRAAGQKRPVEGLSWREALWWLGKTKDTPFPLPPGLRWPSEAEWECARQTGEPANAAAPAENWWWLGEAREGKHMPSGLRLPSEAEWEYACRAGTTTPFAWGETISTDQVAYNVERHYPNEAALHTPNAFGLFDMHGNVWEWCQDAWHDTYEGAPTDGSGWAAPEQAFIEVGRPTGRSVEPGPLYGVARGGSGQSRDARDCRSANRRMLPPGDKEPFVGFRPARSL